MPVKLFKELARMNGRLLICRENAFSLLKLAPKNSVGSTPSPQGGLGRGMQKGTDAGDPALLVVREADTALEGWHSCKIDVLNLLERSCWESLIGSMHIDLGCAEHGWE